MNSKISLNYLEKCWTAGWPNMQIIKCTINCHTKKQPMVMSIVSSFFNGHSNESMSAMILYGLLMTLVVFCGNSMFFMFFHYDSRWNSCFCILTLYGTHAFWIIATYETHVYSSVSIYFKAICFFSKLRTFRISRLHAVIQGCWFFCRR